MWVVFTARLCDKFIFLTDSVTFLGDDCVQSGLTPLHVASFMGHMNIAMFLLQSGSNPNYQTVRGETPLHLATRANQTDIIRVLLRHGAHVDAKARVCLMIIIILLNVLWWPCRCSQNVAVTIIHCSWRYRCTASPVKLERTRTARSLNQRGTCKLKWNNT